MSNPFVMLVDDEEDFVEALSKRLANRDVEVLTSLDGESALEKLDTHRHVEVVILDVKMPGMDGIEVLEEIKKRYPLIEVIMLTGHATVDSAVEGLKSGATDYLMKPTDIDDLIAKAEDAFHNRQKLEGRIRVAQARSSMKSPRQILEESE